MNLSVRNNPFCQYFLIYIIVLSIGLYFRFYPLFSYTSSQTSEKATLIVIAQLRAKVAQQIQNQYPNLPPQQKNELAKKLFDELLHKDAANFRKTIDRLSLNMQKGTPEDKKKFYLMESDSFYYYALTENIINTGKMAETVKGSKYLNTLMLAPQGHWEPFNLHPYIGVGIYNILKIFNPNIDLMYAVSFTPIIISSLALIPFLLICYLLGCHLLVSLTGSIFFILSPIFIKRSLFGWYDNDPYIIFFSLTILASIFYGLKQKTNKKVVQICSGLSCLLFMLYALFWQGWVFFYSIILISGFVIVIYNHFILKNKTSSQRLLIYFGLIYVGSFLAIGIVFGLSDFFVLFKEGWIALENFLTPQLSLWPDIYISVSELKKASLPDILDLTGGRFFFVISLIGVALAIKHLLQRKLVARTFELIIIVVFFVVSFIITCGAQRFALLLLIPMSLMFTFGLQEIKDSIVGITKKFYSKKPQQETVCTIICLTLIVGSTLFPLYSIKTSIKSLFTPLFNETWEKALIKIKDQTPTNSIINAWWPPGHFIKAIAHRRVTFDGATINFPQAYWLANVFLAQDENSALGILRMLNNSANQSVEYLQSLGFPLSKSVEIIKEITPLNKDQARILLPKWLTKTDSINHLLELTHKSPPPSYCFLYNEFVDNNIQLPFIGKWDFKKIEEINARPELLEKIPPHNSKEYINFLWDIVGGPYRYSPLLTQVNQKETTAFFEHNLQINLQTKECRITSDKYGEGIPYSLFYLKDNNVEERIQDGHNLPFCVLLIKNGLSYNTILLDRALAKSLLVRLYFFNAAGLKYFEPFLNESNLTKRTEIKVFRVKWEELEISNTVGGN